MTNKASKKNRVTVILLVAVLLAGLSLLLYPFVSNYWNSLHQSQAIAAYMDDVRKLDDSTYEAMWEEAQRYNASLLEDENRFFPNDEEKQYYEQLLNVSGNGIMGYIEIPSIDVMLPIYHGTSEEVLQVAIGHIEGSSLPIGGESTHSVISGHRGLPSSRLFTDIDQLSEGDTFTLMVLDEVLTYEVDQIRIVEPDDISLLAIEEGQDLCTLVTCTPYGVNSHRLLVRGHRVENQGTGGMFRIMADAMMIDSRYVAIIIAIPILIIVILLMAIRSLKRRKKKAKGLKRRRTHEEQSNVKTDGNSTVFPLDRDRRDDNARIGPWKH